MTCAVTGPGAANDTAYSTSMDMGIYLRRRRCLAGHAPESIRCVTFSGQQVRLARKGRSTIHRRPRPIFGRSACAV